MLGEEEEAQKSISYIRNKVQKGKMEQFYLKNDLFMH